MCGIAGIILKPSVTLPDLREQAVALRDVMVHRGPDDAGMFIDPLNRVALTNRRLAIRDLSPLGHMPMCSDDERVVVTYNGEIYNADELRAELERTGAQFRSTSDTEVILHGFAVWGESILARLRGIFAIGLYDAGRERVLLARDHLGIKPLYYTQTEIGLLFASELKALQASKYVSQALDAASILGYLEFGAVPMPRTIFRHIHALEAGEQIEIRLPTMQLRQARFWSLPTRERAMPTDVVGETRAALADAVRSQLVSDVPLGAFLSGGMDSSAVVALMRQATNGTLRTCSMVFEEAEYSEAPFARAVAEQVGAEHVERVITSEDVLREMPRIMWALDQPTLDGVNSYFVSQTARQAGLTVALSGLGGDELFGGYPTFYDAPLLQQRMARVQQLSVVGRLARQVLSLGLPLGRYAKVLDALKSTSAPASAYMVYRGLFAPSEARQIVRPEVWNAARGFHPADYVAGRAGIPSSHFKPTNGHGQTGSGHYAWTSRAELSTYTLNQLLRDTDVMSMAHSLEVRVPLLDPWLVDKVLPLPDTAKRCGAIQKSLLLQAVGDLLPAVVRERTVKQGFTFPFEHWLRDGLKNYFAAYPFAQSRVLEPLAASNIIARFERRQVHWSRAWTLYVLNTWLHQNPAASF